jgi:LuxR family maltose regulon positive regulatory protein
LCRALRTIDDKAGVSLLRLDCPDEDNCGEVAAILREMKCSSPTWLAVDDFHRIAPLAPASVWKAFLEHDSPMLRLVILTRPLDQSVMPYEKAGFLRLAEDDLRLTERECGEFFAAAGFKLTAEQTRELRRRSEGWIIALSLHLRHFRETREFAPASASGVSALLREVVWDGLGEEDRDLLLRLSPFETWTERQAAVLSKTSKLAAEVVERLRGNAFIRFDPDSGLYAPHSALLNFTRAELKILPEDRRRTVLRAAADWSAMNGERGKAIALYHELRDFEKILSLDLSGLEDDGLLDAPNFAYADVLREVTSNCSREMKIRHPMSMIQLAFEFFGQGRYEEFAELFAEMNELTEEVQATEVERNHLRGELKLLESFTKFNDVAEMGGRVKAAAELTDGRPSLISLSNSWTFGNASVLLMYHSEVGRLDAELADMETYCPHYVALTEGHGGGGATLMRAEALFCRDEVTEAEIACLKARHEAESRGQTSVVIGADLLLGRLAILRGEGEELAVVLERLTSQARENSQKSDRMEASMALAFLDGLLKRSVSASVSDWLLEGTPTSFERRLFTQAVPFAHLCRARLLLLAGKPEIALGESDVVLELAKTLRYPLALIYGHVHRAAAWNMLGRRDQALAETRKALDTALPDGLLMPFAEPPVLIGALNEGRVEEGRVEEGRFAPPPEIVALAKRWEEGRQAVSLEKRRDARPFGLTAKEGETARLARDGLSNAEIAERLEISPNTVKTHLASIYRKSGARSRSTLRKIFETSESDANPLPKRA